MKTKFARFVVAMFLFIILWSFGFVFTPFFVWIFGGSFLNVIQSPYSFFYSVFGTVGWGGVFSEVFDKEINFK